jgi:hypothetical protein
MTEITDIWQNGEEPAECRERIKAKAEALGLNFEDFVQISHDVQTGISTYTDDAGIKERMKIFYEI